MKKVLSVVLSICMLLSLTAGLSVNAFADIEGYFEYSIEGGKASIDRYRGTEEKIAIPSTLGGYPVTKIFDDAFENCTSLISITIPDSVTIIFDDAFRGCSRLTNITIPDSVTDIGEAAFYECSSLVSITIPDSVTGIGEYVFYNCSNLTTIAIPDSLTYIGEGVFCGCTSLSDVYYGASSEAWDKISIGDENEALTNATIHYNYKHVYPSKPVLITEKDCKYEITDSGIKITGYNGKEKNIEIPSKLNGYPVTAIGTEAFFGIENIENIIIPSSVKTIGNGAFSDCTSLMEVTIPKGVTSIGASVFQNCTSLANVTIPESCKSINDYAFYDCKMLQKVTISKGVRNIKLYAFYGCNSLKTVYYNGTNAEWKTMVIAYGNEPLTKATLICASGISNVKKTTTVKTTNTAPAAAKLAKLKAGKKRFTAKWKAVSGVDGYEIQYGLKKNFKKAKKKTVKGAKKTKVTIKKLKSKKKYFVRIRTYKVVNGKKVYSKWSKAKKVKTK